MELLQKNVRMHPKRPKATKKCLGVAERTFPPPTLSRETRDARETGRRPDRRPQGSEQTKHWVLKLKTDEAGSGTEGKTF